MKWTVNVLSTEFYPKCSAILWLNWGHIELIRQRKTCIASIISAALLTKLLEEPARYILKKFVVSKNKTS
jgi:peptidoglycan/LPS O-acetylase OafA/YrhL